MKNGVNYKKTPDFGKIPELSPGALEQEQRVSVRAACPYCFARKLWPQPVFSGQAFSAWLEAVFRSLKRQS
jgi:hypothetical protein